jgi:hypothetical protein
MKSKTAIAAVAATALLAISASQLGLPRPRQHRGWGLTCKRSIISARLCAAVLGLSLVWCHQTFAVPVITVTETTPGQLTLFNGSSNWFIYGFEIERPASASNPTTTQLGWSAYTCTLSCNVGAGGFGYVLDGGNPLEAGIAPGASSSSFFFVGGVPATAFQTEPAIRFLYPSH